MKRITCYFVPLVGIILLLLNVYSSESPLHDRALRSGGRLIEPLEWERNYIVADIDELVKQSQAIIIGEVVDNRTYLSTTKEDLSIEYKVKVTEVFKGHPFITPEIIVIVPGGAYRFPDGVNIFQYIDNLKPIQNNRPYLMFLDR